jgi:hypothetical protein
MPRSRPARCSTSRRRTTPASAAICSRSSYSAKDKKLYALNSGGWAPSGWTPAFFTDTLKQTRVPNNGVNSATVPRRVAGYDALLSRFGTMKFKETFERAARIAEEGWGLAERRHNDLRSAVNGLKNDPDSKQAFLDGDQAWPLYSVISNAESLEGAAHHPGEGQGRLLQRRDRAGDRRQGEGRQRRDVARGSRGVPAGMGRATVDELSRATTCSSCRRRDRASPRSRC